MRVPGWRQKRRRWQISAEEGGFYLTSENEVAGVGFVENGKDYVLVASAFDRYGKRRTRFLQWILLGVYLHNSGIDREVAHCFEQSNCHLRSVEVVLRIRGIHAYLNGEGFFTVE